MKQMKRSIHITLQRLDFEINNLITNDEITDKKKVQLLISYLNPKYFNLWL